MLDIIDWALIGSQAVGFVIDGIQGKIIHDHTKSIKELEGSSGTAAAAYNIAKDAEASAAKANQHADWLHAELDKKNVLPEKPKSEGEIMTDFFKNMTAYMKATTPEQPPKAESTGMSEEMLKKIINDAAIAAVAQGLKQGGK